MHEPSPELPQDSRPVNNSGANSRSPNRSTNRTDRPQLTLHIAIKRLFQTLTKLKFTRLTYTAQLQTVRFPILTQLPYREPLQVFRP